MAAAFSLNAHASYQLEDAASKAVTSNPDVLNKWRQMKAAGEERNVSWGGFLPTVDILFGVGHEEKKSPLYTPYERRNYDFHTYKVMLKQNLFSGFATTHDTKRLEHATLVRFYEMLDQSENAAFEATKAYVDVWRYRQLVKYAEDNYGLHRLFFDKIKVRHEKGLGRQVDMETAAGRLALAESNLLTENSNLHDVLARFQRIVGVLPPEEMTPPPRELFFKNLPTDRKEALQRSLDNSPQMKAAFHNVLSAMRNVSVQRSAYSPQVNGYIEHGQDSKVGGYAKTYGQPADNTNTTTVGVTVSWNLFNGNRDVARERKAIEEKYSAYDVREKVCRDLRQNVLMAFNEQSRLNEQIKYLGQHQESSDKAREAFRRQFYLGQRSLLDVLDTENEYYTARRNLLNGEQDMLIAHAKYHFATGNLLNLLQLKRLDIEPPTPDTTPEEQLALTCPPDVIEPLISDKEAAFQREKAKDKDSGNLGAENLGAPSATPKNNPWVTPKKP